MIGALVHVIPSVIIFLLLPTFPTRLLLCRVANNLEKKKSYPFYNDFYNGLRYGNGQLKLYMELRSRKLQGKLPIKPLIQIQDIYLQAVGTYTAIRVP